MALIVRNFKIDWSWDGDASSLRGFSVVIVKSDDYSVIVASREMSSTDRTCTLMGVTVDPAIQYIAGVQAHYVGKDSDWVSSTGLTVPDDGTAPPGVIYGLVDTYGYVGDGVTQDFTELTGNPTYMRRWRRTGYNNVWAAWRQVYDQGSILGTVSQASGVPTGAIIQRGSNANGEYVKFADGTMICNGVIASSETWTSTAIGIRYSGTTAATFPHAFSIVPYVTFNVRDVQVADRSAWQGYSANTTTGITAFYIVSVSGSTVTQSIFTRYTAIGRWF